MIRFARIIALLGAVLLCALPAYAEPAESDEPIILMPDQIRQVQRALYEMNFNPGSWDGILGSKTRSAIAAWQRANHRDTTGELTKVEFYGLLAASTIPRIWGAVSASLDGTYAGAWNHKTRTTAEEAVLAECRRRSREPENCIVMAGQQALDKSDKPAWIGARLCKTRRDSTQYLHLHTALNTTQGRTLQTLQQATDAEGYLRNECTLLIMIEATGKHKR